MKSKNWFEVSKEGLKSLQAGKPKHYILRELVQNAWDENIKKCEVELSYEGKEAQIKVIDDSPEGFKDLTDAFTLFKSTSKRTDPQKRGRFNVGEKQAIALATRAKITTTKGTIVFEKEGRRNVMQKRELGSEVVLWVKMKKEEYDEMLNEISKYLVPEGIEFIVNGIERHYHTPEQIISTSLETEIEENGIMKKMQRKTEIWVYAKSFEKAILYEMGLPICEIDCKYDISIQQKVPMGIDRETVSQKYLSNIFAEVLNMTYQEIDKSESSDIWVREATGNGRIVKEAVSEIVKKRFGDKVVVANPFDPNSIDEAISHGFNVVYGSELSKDEWDKIKKDDLMSSSTDLFGKSLVGATTVEPNSKQEKIGLLVAKIAEQILGIKIKVSFFKSEATEMADFGGNVLSFNVSKIPADWWDGLKGEMLGLIIHELAHSKGNHTEMSYHECLTGLAGDLIVIALKEPDFFK